jgi:2-phospho-L-lactate/phosphoenolpyruvate guanylyltransferase
VRTAAVLPVKSFGRAKQRLAGAVAAPARRDLAAAMVADVLDALRAVRAVDDLLVVTAEPVAARAARAVAAHVIHDPLEAGQSAAARRGIAAAVDRGATRALLVPGDCPALDPLEVEDLLRDPGREAMTIVADRHGTGTNALVLSPPDLVTPAFGPDSFARHTARAAAAGACVRVAELPSLALDVDTADDLRALESALAARPWLAPRTRAGLPALAA